jgi:hypothetical protein
MSRPSLSQHPVLQLGFPEQAPLQANPGAMRASNAKQKISLE